MHFLRCRPHCCAMPLLFVSYFYAFRIPRGWDTVDYFKELIIFSCLAKWENHIAWFASLLFSLRHCPCFLLARIVTYLYHLTLLKCLPPSPLPLHFQDLLYTCCTASALPQLQPMHPIIITSWQPLANHFPFFHPHHNHGWLQPFDIQTQFPHKIHLNYFILKIQFSLSKLSIVKDNKNHFYTFFLVIIINLNAGLMCEKLRSKSKAEGKEMWDEDCRCLHAKRKKKEYKKGNARGWW